MRARFALLATLPLLLLAAACGTSAPPVVEEGARVLYDPLSGTPTAFPDDYYTVDDPQSLTGVRVHMKPGENLQLPADFNKFLGLFADLSRLDGFGTTSQLFFRVEHPVDESTIRSVVAGEARGATLFLADLDAPVGPFPAEPRIVEIDWTVVPENGGGVDDSVTIVISPRVPLRPRRHYALLVTSGVRGMDGKPLRPSAYMKSVLDGTVEAPGGRRLLPRYRALLSDAVVSAVLDGQEVAAAVVFTTQHTVEDSAAVATDLRKKKYSWREADGAPQKGCTTDPNNVYRACDGVIDGFDYRVDKHHLDEANVGAKLPWKLPVTIYLPTTPNPNRGPYPTILYGHGLGGDRRQAAQLAALAAKKGYAVVACDAVKHGDHPDKAGKITGSADLDTILDFFGFGLGDQLIDSRKLRDNFRQSTFDKLQVTEALRPGVDADGDSLVDVSLDKFLYLGVSLGGIMSAEYLALAPEAQVGVPIVPGARVTQIVSDGKQFAVVIGLFRATATDGDVARFFPLLQSAIDRGDSGVWARHVISDRLPGFDSRAPEVLMQMVIDDDTVPNSTNRYFARALGAPHVGDELQQIGVIPHQPKLPVSGNIGGKRTAGVFQYDVVWNGDGPATKTATHGNVAANPVAITQTLRFIDSHFAGGPAEIIDPYRTLGIKK